MQIGSFFKGVECFQVRVYYPPIYCQKQPSKGALRNTSSVRVVRNLEKYLGRTSVSKYHHFKKLRKKVN